MMQRPGNLWGKRVKYYFQNNSISSEKYEYYQYLERIISSDANWKKEITTEIGHASQVTQTRLWSNKIKRSANIKIYNFIVKSNKLKTY